MRSPQQHIFLYQGNDLIHETKIRLKAEGFVHFLGIILNQRKIPYETPYVLRLTNG